MNILFLTLLYPEETKVQTAAASRDGLQNQIDNYQRAFVRGIRENLRKGESLELVNSLPVGISRCAIANYGCAEVGETEISGSFPD